jgi:molybdate transport system substrate-binding protein
MNRSWPYCKIPAAGAILLFVAFLSRPALAQQQQIRIAAAADLQFAMPELAGQFEKQSGAKVIVSYGSSGNFFSQIQNGAPFDLFFSADISYPRRLEAAGLCEPGTLFPYAFGRIVIWVPPGSPDDDFVSGWKALLDPSVRKIAVANPAHAPYGRAAVAALKSAGIYDQVESKLVYGENVSQSAQFVQSGSAQAGILALSLVLSPAMRGGHYWVIPQNLYPPMEQGAMILKSSKNKDPARSFLKFVRSPAGRATLESFGFQTPVPPAPEVKN